MLAPGTRVLSYDGVPLHTRDIDIEAGPRIIVREVWVGTGIRPKPTYQSSKFLRDPYLVSYLSKSFREFDSQKLR